MEGLAHFCLRVVIKLLDQTAEQSASDQGEVSQEVWVERTGVILPHQHIPPPPFNHLRLEPKRPFPHPGVSEGLHGLNTFTTTGISILGCSATDVSNDTLPLTVLAGTSSNRAMSS